MNEEKSSMRKGKTVQSMLVIDDRYIRQVNEIYVLELGKNFSILSCAASQSNMIVVFCLYVRYRS